MFAAQVREKFGGGPGAACSYIFVALADSLNRFREVLPLPFQIGRQGIIKSGRGVLATPFGVLFELRLTPRLEWDSYPRPTSASFDPIVRRSVAQVKTYLTNRRGCTASFLFQPSLI